MRYALSTLLLLCALGMRAQPFNWQWAVAVPGGMGAPPGMANDAEGNTYIAGSFAFSITFAPLAPLTGTDYNDGYVVKYDDQGEALWAAPLSGGGVDICRGLSLDAAGNVYVTGDFNGSTLTIGSITLTGNGLENIFVAKFTTDGQPVWARNFTDTNGEFETGRSIATNAQGESYVTGSYQGTMALNDAPTLTACVNNASMFLMKLDTDGNVLWNLNPACPDSPVYACRGDKVALDPDGDLYVAGRFSSPQCTVGDSTLVNTSSGTDNILFARFDPDGTQQWVHGMGGVNADQVRALTTDASGNCYLGITRNDDIVVPEFTVGAIGPIGPYLIAILKCDPDGHFLLGERIGNSDGNHSIFSLTALPDGSFYAGGQFEFDCVIDGFYFPFIDFDHLFSGFLVRYDPAGVAQQVLVFQSDVQQILQSLSHDEATNVYAAGTFQDTVTIGTLPILDVPSTGLFLARSGDFTTEVNNVASERPTPLAYPNPTDGQLRIDALLPFDRIEVTDAQGKVLLARSFSARNAIDLDLSAHGTLLYTLWSKDRLLGKGRVVLE